MQPCEGPLRQPEPVLKCIMCKACVTADCAKVSMLGNYLDQQGLACDHELHVFTLREGDHVAAHGLHCLLSM